MDGFYRVTGYSSVTIVRRLVELRPYFIENMSNEGLLKFGLFIILIVRH